MTKRLWVRMLAKDNFTQKKFVMIENKQNRPGMARLKILLANDFIPDVGIRTLKEEHEGDPSVPCYIISN